MADLSVLSPTHGTRLVSDIVTRADIICDSRESDRSQRPRRNQPSVTIDFLPDCDGEHGVAAAGREHFRSDFAREFNRLDDWSRENDWPLRCVPDLKVTVAARYRISKSLVPAWNGENGHMLFPAWRVAVRNAAIAHELVHVFLPNGNRFLAEGLAIYLQAKIGGNPAFPNFGKPLHALAHELRQAMVPCAGEHGSDRLLLRELDAIATPGPLVLAIGQDFYGEEARGQAHLYPLAGSFVQFLIETRGLDTFRRLYACTPLVPLTLNGGAPGRWNDIYRLSLAALEAEWDWLLREADAGNAPQPKVHD